MGNGPALVIPYWQLHHAIGLCREIATEAPGITTGPLLRQVLNLLEGPSGPNLDADAGTPWEGKDPPKVPFGIIPALEQAMSRHKLRDAEPAVRFVEYAREIILRAAPRRDKPEIKWDVNEIRRAAKVVGFLLQAALAVFP
jgi:hypothetical protein